MDNLEQHSMMLEEGCQYDAIVCNDYSICTGHATTTQVVFLLPWIVTMGTNALSTHAIKKLDASTTH